MSFNKVIVMGNLTRDCELRFAANGTAIVKFGLAINRRFQDADGSWKEKPTFVDVTIFGKRGEAFAKFHSKGSIALLEGQLRMDVWEDSATHQRRSKLYVVAEGWEFAGDRRPSRDESRSPAEGAPAFEGGNTSGAVDETPF